MLLCNSEVTYGEEELKKLFLFFFLQFYFFYIGCWVVERGGRFDGWSLDGIVYVVYVM